MGAIRVLFILSSWSPTLPCSNLALLAAGYDACVGTGGDRLGDERHRLHDRAAYMVDLVAWPPLADAGANGRLTRRVLALPGRQHLSHHDLGHLCGFDAGAAQRLADGDGAELVGAELREGTVER